MARAISAHVDSQFGLLTTAPLKGKVQNTGRGARQREGQIKMSNANNTNLINRAETYLSGLTRTVNAAWRIAGEAERFARILCEEGDDGAWNACEVHLALQARACRLECALPRARRLVDRIKTEKENSGYFVAGALPRGWHVGRADWEGMEVYASFSSEDDAKSFMSSCAGGDGDEMFPISLCRVE